MFYISTILFYVSAASLMLEDVFSVYLASVYLASVYLESVYLDMHEHSGMFIAC